MKASELRQKSVSELQSLLLELLREQFNLRMQRGNAGQVAKPSRIRAIRRDVARIKTTVTALAMRTANND